MRPHVPHKTRSPLWRRGKWRGRLTPVRINENPVKGGTRSLLRQDVPRKPPRLNVLRWNSENNPYRGLGRSVMTHCGILSRLDLCLYYSLYGNTWKFVLQSRTLFSGVHYLLEELGGGTRLAMPKTICAPDSSSLKPGSGATEGVLD